MAQKTKRQSGSSATEGQKGAIRTRVRMPKPKSTPDSKANANEEWQLLKCRMLKCSNARMFKCSNAQMLKCQMPNAKCQMPNARTYSVTFCGPIFCPYVAADVLTPGGANAQGTLSNTITGWMELFTKGSRRSNRRSQSICSRRAPLLYLLSRRTTSPAVTSVPGSKSWHTHDHVKATRQQAVSHCGM